MTQHPFEREYSEQEAQKLNSESTASANEDELTDQEAEDVAGGIIRPTVPRFEEGIDPSSRPSFPSKDPITDGKLENGGLWAGK